METASNNIDSGSLEANISIDQEATAVQTEVKHEITLFAEPVFYAGNFPITNSLLNSWIVVFIIIVFSLILRSRIATIPKGIQNYAEVILEQTFKLADSVTGSREKTLRFLPIVLPLFIFILLNNWLGLLPGVGSIGFIQTQAHEKVFVPLFRGATADLNTTLALGITAVLLTHILGVTMTGPASHLNRFLSLKLIFDIPKKVFKERDFKALLLHPIQFFVGIIEIIGELSKIASLSFRLFGNIFAGEVLLGAMAAIFAFAIPIPFMFLEIVVGIVQALIFSLLTLVFLSVMTTKHDSSEEHA